MIKKSRLPPFNKMIANLSLEERLELRKFLRDKPDLRRFIDKIPKYVLTCYPGATLLLEPLSHDPENGEKNIVLKIKHKFTLPKLFLAEEFLFRRIGAMFFRLKNNYIIISDI